MTFPSKAENNSYDVIVIGAGPAGASAALYTSRSKLHTLVIDKAPGAGALAITHKIANYPGVQGEMTGLQLLESFWRQAREFGAEFIEAPVQAVDLSSSIKYVYTPDETYEARAVIIATGARGRARKLPGEDRFQGRGVSYCGTCDAPFFQGKKVVVVGDTEELIKEASTLARFADHVDVVIPASRIAGSESVDVLAEFPNVSIHSKTKPLEIIGDEKVTGLLVAKNGNAQEVLPADGVFMFLSGNGPSSEFLVGQVQCDAEGYLQPDSTMATDVPGVFAAGDIRKTPVKQAVIAAADGALAAIAADQYLHSRSRLMAQR